MTARELYTKGARVWIPHPTKVWEGAAVTADFRSGVLIVRTDDEGVLKQIPVDKDENLPNLRNPDILIGENDLTSLSYLHEPAVLHNLKVRFCDLNAIYTYCGIVLVAINPYDDLPIYGEETILAYRGQAMGDLDPHIFAVAEEAYTKLEREKRDQSIIVSGESGAGKTVSAKYAMRYFATVGGSGTETQVEKKVLASSPIMEAIGNAKTTRNDNSSRFGKFIEIHFDKSFRIIGASMRTYLLEKSRVVFQAPEERNYHIFYQLCSVRNEMPDLFLEHQDKFAFLNQGNNPVIDGVDDAVTFNETKRALNTLGFSESEQKDMFKIWSAILHLGNVQIVEYESEDAQTDDRVDSSAISLNDKHLKIFCSLLGLNPEDVAHKLTNRKIISRSEVIIKPLGVTEARAAREALAKHIYAELFSWVVSIANKALRCTQPVVHFIGVLDIYGFETFETNSFEQFCINYANEKLQQQFNSHVFKLEQEEYLREEITWTMIHFYDNQPCIDLIEARLGVLDLLDEECRMPQGSDSSWVSKLYSKCSQSSHFVKPRFGTNAFVIKHFADDVEYQVHGFLEKNRDTVLEEQIESLRESENCQLLRDLLSLTAPATLDVPRKNVRIKVSPSQVSTKQHRQSVGAQFRESLTALMATLNATTPHYVRCIKPNDDKKAFQYDPVRAVQQLRACGVLETIRISAAGFPSRWLYQDFFLRYRVLCYSKDIDRNDPKVTCSRIIKKCIKDEDKYRFGRAKIFFRAGQVAYLEKLRAERLRRCCIIVQSQLRAYVCRKNYLRIRSAVCGLQRYGRGYLARKLAHQLRRQRAAKVLQKHVRGWLARTNYKRLKATAIGIQRYGRGYLARRRFMELKYNAAAIVIQKYVRGWLARRKYAKMRRQIVICQASARRFLARRQYKRLRAEARSVEHVKKLNRGLENKIISLQQKIETLQSDNRQIAVLVAEIADLKLKLEPMRSLENEVKKLRIHVNEKDAIIAKITSDLTVERDNNIELVELKNKQEELYKKDKKEWQYESEKIAKELTSLKEINVVNQKDFEKKMREQHDLEKRELISELDNEKTAYQRLLTEKYELQTRLEEVQTSNRNVQGHQRSLSNASNVSQPETIEDDYGYGSVKSSLKGFDSKELNKSDVLPDPSIVIRLQRWCKQYEEDKMLLIKQIERLESARLETAMSSDSMAARAEDQHRINELEIECTKLSDDLKRLRASVARADGADVSAKELAEQFSAQQEELERRREECIQLRSILANQRPWFQALKDVTVNLKSLATSSYGSDVDVINEDGELVQAFEAQKKITRQLEDELLHMKEHFRSTLLEYQSEMDKLRKENEDIRLCAGNITEPQTQKDQIIQYEVARIATENVALKDRNTALVDSCEKYKKQVKLLTQKLKDLGIEDPEDSATNAANLKDQKPIKRERDPVLPVVRKKERDDYMGMFEYKNSQDSPQNRAVESLIIRRLVTDLSPRTAVTLLPGLPAYILFMCIRYTDHVNDEDKVKSLLNHFMNGVKKVVKKKSNDIDTTILWLSNTLRLLHCLKQYSGEVSYQGSNTPTQNEQCLRNFDLSEYRQVLSDIAVWIYQGLIQIVEKRIHGIIIGALLEYEEISGVSGGVPRGRAQSVGGSTDEVPRSPINLTNEFTLIRKTLDYFGIDPELVLQIFKQIYYFVCASCLNQLLLRRDLCRWSKGMQIRYNISYLEVWLKENLATYDQQEVTAVQTTLNPIIQAVYLLQARKSSADVQSTCDMCPDLTPLQICKLLNLYTPAEDFEPKITTEFIKEIQICLQERDKGKTPNDHANLLMDSKYNFAVRFPFNPSPIRLENVELPEVLNLHDLLTKI